MATKTTPEIQKEKKRVYMREYMRGYYKKNKIKLDKYCKQWQENNSEQYKKCRRNIAKNWAAKNRPYRTALQIKREKAKINRTPKWLTEDDIRFITKFYEESEKLSKETGIRHNVDHIIPLQGKNVSGLHVPWNLQILPEKENFRKSNRHES